MPNPPSLNRARPVNSRLCIFGVVEFLAFPNPYSRGLAYPIGLRVAPLPFPDLENGLLLVQLPSGNAGTDEAKATWVALKPERRAGVALPGQRRQSRRARWISRSSDP
jgi:hypothetical protein